MTKELIIFKEKLKICELHLSRLNLAFERIKRYYPFQENNFPLSEADDLAYLDMFTMRFAKLQDYMGEKLFPTVLDVLGNRHESLSYIDILNILEKIRILESAAKWRELRNLRNKISHEYPNSYNEQCCTLNKIMDSFSYLEKTLKIIKETLEKYEHTA